MITYSICCINLALLPPPDDAVSKNRPAQYPFYNVAGAIRGLSRRVFCG